MVGGDSFQIYTGTLTGPSSFGSLLKLELANSSSGNYVGLVDYSGVEQIRVPAGYTSGDPLTDSMTFDNTTLAALGLTAGTYTWSWSPPALPDDSFELVVQSPATVPEPLTLSIFGAGLAGAAALRRRKKAKQA